MKLANICWDSRQLNIECLIEFVISFGDAMSFPILVITIITYYLISRKIKESVVLILLKIGRAHV